jgi:hypothetical protein
MKLSKNSKVAFEIAVMFYLQMIQDEILTLSLTSVASRADLPPWVEVGWGKIN